MVDVDVFSSKIEGISPKVIEFVDINAVLFIRNQVEFPWTSRISFSIDQSFNPIDLRVSYPCYLFEIVINDEMIEED